MAAELLALAALALLLLVVGGRSPRWPAPRAAAAAAGRLPPAAVLAPMAGDLAGLDAFLAALRGQDYPGPVRLVLIVEEAREAAGGAEEAAVKVAGLEREGLPPDMVVVRAPRAMRSSQKAANLVAGLAALGGAEVVALADADALPHRTWLRELVAPLAAAGRGGPPLVTTGFRWYIPAGGLAGVVRAAFSAAALGVVADPRRAFAWGGSLALWRRDLERLGIPAAWRTALSDDMAVTRAVRAAGGAVRFVPECVVPSFGAVGWRALVEFAVRQVVMLRRGDVRLWGVLLAYHAALAATQVGAVLAALGAGEWPGGGAGRLAAVVLLAAPTGLGAARAAARFAELADRPIARVSGWDRGRTLHVALAPLMTWFMLAALAAGGFRRRVAWCGIRYRLGAGGAVEVGEVDEVDEVEGGFDRPAGLG